LTGCWEKKQIASVVEEHQVTDGATLWAYFLATSGPLQLFDDRF